MKLEQHEEEMLRAVAAGIKETESFTTQKNDFFGDAVTTEYLLTADVAKALWLRQLQDVRVEFVINNIIHLLVKAPGVNFTLGSRRFDVAVLDSAGTPYFAVEMKIRVRSLSGSASSGTVEDDLKKIISYLGYLKCPNAQKKLGLCAFQVFQEAAGRRQLEQTTQSIHRIESSMMAELDAFSKRHPNFEFSWVSFQGPTERIFDDEETTDSDDVTPMFGRYGYACRYHGILVRRLCDGSAGGVTSHPAVS